MVAMLRALGLAVWSFVFSCTAAEEDHVLTLTTANFDDTLKQHSRVLVEFYAPWCGHCKQLEPEYKRAAAAMKAEKLETVLAKVDATEEKELGSRYGVSGYPTLKYFVKGEEPQEYGGGRTADTIKAWLAKRELPAVVPLDGERAKAYVAAAEKFAASGGDLPDDTPADGFRLVAKVVKKSARAKAYLAAVQNHFVDWEVVSIRPEVVYLPKSVDPKGPEISLVLWRPGFQEDPKMVEFPGKWTEGAIATWTKSSVYPIIGTSFSHKLYGAHVAESMGKVGTVVVVLDDGAEDDEEDPAKKLRPSVLKELMPLQAAEPKWFFTAVSLDKLMPAEHEILGTSGRTPSTVVVLQGKSKYHLREKGDGAVTKPGAIKDLLDSVKSKKAKPFYKSAAVPDPEVDSDGVTVIVGDTFEKHVMDSTKDVFVEFYAPWCGHCKKLTPVWAELAQTSKAKGWTDRGLTIAKMDATENECPEEISGFPKLIFYPAVKAEKKLKAKMDYSGARDLEPLIDFVLESAVKLEGVGETGEKKVKKSKGSMVERDLARKKAAAAGKGSEL